MTLEEKRKQCCELNEEAENKIYDILWFGCKGWKDATEEECDDYLNTE